MNNIKEFLARFWQHVILHDASILDEAKAYVDEQGFRGSWNDLTDRPFGKTVSEVVLCDVPVEEGVTNYSAVSVSTQLVIGQVYTVVWDGVTYSNLVCFDDDGYTTIGAVFGNTTDNLPFCIENKDNDANALAVYTHQLTGPHSLKITTESEVIKTLDPKYLPSIPQDTILDIITETGVISTAISDHNASTTAHSDIRNLVDGKVSTSRTINGKDLSTNITLSASDVGAAPASAGLPTVSASNNGKILQVSNGAWAIADAPQGFSGSWNDLTNKPFADMDALITQIKTQIGYPVVSATAPTLTNSNIIWIDTSKGGIAKYYNGSAWVAIASAWIDWE